VHINLLAVPGTRLDQVRTAVSHTVLLGQCRDFLREHGIAPEVGADTAGSAEEVARLGDPARAALAGDIAAEIYKLDTLARHIEDHTHNTTRFLLMSREPDYTRRGKAGMMTSFVFRVRNIPAALYKAMGGFATNGVNMTKLESYMVEGSFSATQFYADIEGHPDDRNVRLALDELDYFTTNVALLGVYPADPRRR
jgi:prephenate dehydratase